MAGLPLLSLRPITGDVVEIFGIGADLLKQCPAGLDVRQVLFALVFAAALVDQTMPAPDAFERVMADGQIEFANEAARAESGKGLSERDHLSLDGRRRLVRLVVSRPGVLDQARRSLLLEATEPLADPGRGGGEQARGGLDAALAGAFDQPQAMVIGVVFHLTNQIEIASGNHSPRIVAAAAERPRRLWKSRSVENQNQVFHCAWKSRPARGIPTFPQPRRRSFAPPTQQQNHLPAPLLTQTFQPRQGYTM